MQTTNHIQDKPLVGGTEAAKVVGLTRSRFYRFVHAGVFKDAIIAVPGCEMLFRRAVLLEWANGAAQ